MRVYSFIGLLCLLVAGVAWAQEHASNKDDPQKVDQTVKAPIPTVTPEAEMPNEARQMARGGICLISLIVDAYGMPINPRVVRCTDPMFEKNSVEAVMKYRFKPAKRISDGTAVAVMISIEINFRFGAPGSGSEEPPLQVRYGFFSPPGMTSLEQDADGVYPFSRRIEPPKMVRFVSNGFGRAAMLWPDGTGCQVVLTLNAKGKPIHAETKSCDKPNLEKPAIDSLMNSKFKPAKFNGKEVSVRLTVALVYDGFGPHKELNGPSPASVSKP